jgi:hypothetical protein
MERPMTSTLPFPFNGPSGALKSAFDALASVYCAGTKVLRRRYRSGRSGQHENRCAGQDCDCPSSESQTE